MHVLFYSDDPEATRTFFADVLELPSAGATEASATEAGTTEASTTTEGDPGAWLVFRSGPSEIGVLPATGPHGEQWAPPGQHQVTFVCDDIARTVQRLRERGAVFAGEPGDLGFGVGLPLNVPGGADVLVYEPRHPVAYDLEP